MNYSMFIFVMHLYLDTFLCLIVGGRGGGRNIKNLQVHLIIIREWPFSPWCIIFIIFYYLYLYTLIKTEIGSLIHDMSAQEAQSKERNTYIVK